MLGSWLLPQRRPWAVAVRFACLAAGLAVLALSILMALDVALLLVSSRSLNATGSLAIPRWLDALTERREVAYPAHAAIGTTLELLNLSPAATAVQWLKAAAHASSEQDLERTAQGMAAALARDHQGAAMQTLCTVREIGNVQQQHAAGQSGLNCDQWAPAVALKAAVSAQHAAAGSVVSITAQVTSVTDVVGLVDVEVHNADGERLAQWVFRQQIFAAGDVQTYVVEWEIPPALPPGRYVVKLGLFEPGWRALHGWRNAAATIDVSE